MRGKNRGYVIGVDGGGTKTTAALASLEGKILKISRSGSSSPRNIGIKKSVENIAKVIKPLFKKEVLFIYIGLPAVAEEFKNRKKEIKREILRKIPSLSRERIDIGSDQMVAFRSGTNEETGILVIAGTGSVIRGWRREKKVHVSGWGWLADEGSAFFIGQKTLQAILKDMDGRGEKTLLTKVSLRELEIESEDELINTIYSDPTRFVPFLSVICDKVSKNGDRVAKGIMLEAARELILGAETTIKKLRLKDFSFPVVLIGGVFKSEIVLEEFKKGVKKVASESRFIRPQKAPVIGAVKLAIERIS